MAQVGDIIPDDQVPATTETAPPTQGAPPQQSQQVFPSGWTPPPQQSQQGTGFIPDEQVPAGVGGSATPDGSYSSRFLPLTADSSGRIHFDSNAGLMGQAKSAASLPGDVLTGKTTMADPATQQRAIAAGMLPQMDSLAGVVPNMVRPSPTTAALQAAAQEGYKAGTSLPVIYSTGGVQAALTGAFQKLRASNIQAPNAFGAYQDAMQLNIRGPSAGEFPISQVENLRSGFSKLSVDKDPNERMAGAAFTNAINDLYTKPDPRIVSGPWQQATQLLTQARANAAAGFRASLLDRNAAAAEARGESATSDQNKSMQSRMRFLSDPLQPQRLAGFSPEELAGVAAAGRSNTTQTIANAANRALGEKGVVAGLLGEHFGGPYGAVAGFAVPPLVNFASRHVGSNAFNAVDRMVRERSPLYAETPAVTNQKGSRASVAGRLGVPMGGGPPVNPSPYIPATRGLDTPMPQLYD